MMDFPPHFSHNALDQSIRPGKHGFSQSFLRITGPTTAIGFNCSLSCQDLYYSTSASFPTGMMAFRCKTPPETISLSEQRYPHESCMASPTVFLFNFQPFSSRPGPALQSLCHPERPHHALGGPVQRSQPKQRISPQKAGPPCRPPP